MPRSPRLAFPGAIYHVTARGNRKQEIVRDDRDRDRFIEFLAEVIAERGWRCHAYCLMSNHYHLLVETPNGDISAGIQRLNGGYAQWFNRRHDLNGHLFQGRFHAVLVESDWHLLELARYIVLNPVRAGVSPGPRGWRWSSYRALAGHARCPRFLTVDWLLGFFGKNRAEARDGFRRFVADAPPRARGP